MFELILQLHAHKKGSGSTHNGRDSNAQRLGTKAHDGQFVTAGSIIVHMGKNVGMGKDYTIFAKVDGKVAFERWGKDRRIISIVPVEAEA